MKDLSRTKGRPPSKAEQQAAARELAEQRAATPFKPEKPKRPPRVRQPSKGREPVRIYTREEIEKLIEARPHLQEQMAVSAEDK